MTTIDISPEAVERLACILEGRGGFVKDSTITATLLALSAALTQSRAETAAAYERAAETLAIRQQDYRPDTTTWLQIQMDIHSIRALATPDQSSALAAIEAAAEARGMRRAAEIVSEQAIETDSTDAAFQLGDASRAILAAIPQGEIK